MSQNSYNLKQYNVISFCPQFPDDGGKARLKNIFLLCHLCQNWPALNQNGVEVSFLRHCSRRKVFSTFSFRYQFPPFERKWPYRSIEPPLTSRILIFCSVYMLCTDGLRDDGATVRLAWRMVYYNHTWIVPACDCLRPEISFHFAHRLS